MVKISDLFNVERGNASSPDDYSTGNFPLVSASTSRNGIVKHIAPGKKDRGFGSAVPACLAVAVDGEGSVMFASMQKGVFYSTVSVEVLTPRMDNPFWGENFERRLAAFAAVIRTNRWRFSFGRKPAGRLKDLEIDEQQIATIAAGLIIATPTQNTLPLSMVQNVIAKLQQAYGPSPRIADVFDIKSMSGVGADGLKESGAIPVVGADGNITNGVIGYLDALPGRPFPKETLSVAKNGSNAGVCRAHRCEWGATGDVACLNPKMAWAFDELLVLAALVESQEWRFFYGRKASSERLSDLSLCL